MNIDTDTQWAYWKGMKEFEAKYRSKREVYHFLSVDTGIYLPSYGE